MKITINDHRKIFAVQKEFSGLFPYLKLEFFAKPHKVGAPSSKAFMKNASKTLGESRVQHNKGTLTIMPAMTVSELEQNFNDVYGLHVQVFRRSGNAWLETTVTNHWTLEKQNQQGEELSRKQEVAAE